MTKSYGFPQDTIVATLEASTCALSPEWKHPVSYNLKDLGPKMGQMQPSRLLVHGRHLGSGTGGGGAARGAEALAPCHNKSPFPTLGIPEVIGQWLGKKTQHVFLRKKPKPDAEQREAEQFSKAESKAPEPDVD